MGIQQLLNATLSFINTILFPTLLACALIVFLWNIVRYFIIGGANEEDQTKAKSVALWGILAFVVIAGIWSIVAIFVNVFGLGGKKPITPDYMQSRGVPTFPAGKGDSDSCIGHDYSKGPC